MKDKSSVPTLQQCPVVITLPVQWGDQDAFGHVNNTVPIRWFESARIAYLDRAESGLMQMVDGVGPILAAVDCHYRRQLTFPDSVDIGSRVQRIGRSSMVIEHVVYSRSQGWLAVDGHSVVVAFDYRQQRPIRIPDAFRRAAEQLEGRAI